MEKRHKREALTKRKAKRRTRKEIKIRMYKNIIKTGNKEYQQITHTKPKPVIFEKLRKQK